MVQIGSWGTPELGITERLSNFFGQGRTATGGSNLFGNQAQTTLVPSSSNQFVPSGGSGAYGVQSGNYLQSSPVLSGGSGGGGNPSPSPTGPTPQGGGGPDLEGQARDQAQIDLENALSEFDYNKQGLEAQSGQLDQQRLSSFGELETQRGRAQNEATTAKTEATSATKTAQSKALSTAQDVQRKNRNVLRALGILSSSAGGEMLTKPMTEYGSQSAELQQGLVDRIGKVEQWWMDRSKDFDTAKQGIEQQYAALKDNISRDLRFNDRQRLTAVKAASAALNARIGEIQQQKMAYENAAKQYSDSILLQIAQMKMYQNPTADTSAILNTLLSQAQQGYTGPTAAMTMSEEQRKKQQQGMLSGLGTIK